MTRHATLDVLLNRLVKHSREVVESEQGEDRTARVLLADLFACIVGSGARGALPETATTTHFAHDGTCGRVATLALRAHSRDLDDIFWPAGLHPGSIVWPVVLALGAEVGASGARLLHAARMGYQYAGDTAQLLGSAHARLWHMTATAGMVGSAAAAAALLDLDSDMTAAACGHAAAMAGGVGQSVIEKSATLAFHRSAAAVTGVLAARVALSGAVPSREVLEGPRGVLALLAPDSTGIVESSAAVLGATSVRLFPVNGFSQGAVELTAGLRREFDGVALAGANGSVVRPRSIIVEVAEMEASATTGEWGGDWWDMRGAVAAAWASGDAFHLQPTTDSWSLRKVVRVVGRVGGFGATRIIVNLADTELLAELARPPGYQPTDDRTLRLLKRKWAGLGADDPLERADRVLAKGIGEVEVGALCHGVVATSRRPE